MKIDKEKRKALLFLVIVLVVLLVVVELLSFNKSKHEFLEVSYLNVGQGDATLISYLGKYQVLIDGGPSGKRLLRELDAAMPLMDRKIEVVILTHPDKDHLAGLIDVLRNYQVDSFFDNGQAADTQIFRELEGELIKGELERKTLLEGSAIAIGSHLKFKVFNPDQKPNIKEDRNEKSIVLRMDFGTNSFLFTGDATDDSESDMLGDLEDVDVDWLKLGHHGSKHSTSDDFLKKVSPQFAIASAGLNNRYKHPNEEVIEKLFSQGVKLLRTDELGTIKVECSSLELDCLLSSE